MRFLLVLALLWWSIVPSRAAPSLTGLWETPHRDAVIEIAPCDNGICGWIVGLFLDLATDRMPVNYKGVSQCRLALITDVREIHPNLWRGHITDPRNGHIYGVELHIDAHGNLALRGFIGIPLLGSTQTWTRYPSQPPADCRIGPRS